MLKPGSMDAAGTGSGAAQAPSEFEFAPSSGETIQIPATDSPVVNVTLWPVNPISDFQLILPLGLTPGQRVFIFAGQAVSNMTVTSADVGVQVRNNVVSLNVNDLVVFNTVSTVRKVIARVVAS